MAITLFDVIQMPGMEHAKLLTKHHQLQTQVSGISIMEAPDIMDWVERGAIILSSLYCVYDSESNMRYFLESLRRKPPCALIIKLGLYVEAVPKPLMAVAEEHGFAVMTISAKEQPYSEILYPIMAALFESQVISLKKYKETQSLLTGYALKNAGMEGITRAFSEIVRNPACVYNKELTLLFSTWPSIIEGQQRLLSEYDENGIPYLTARLTLNGIHYVQYLTPIHVMGNVAGYLGVIEQERRLNDLDFIAMQNATTVLSLELLKDFAVREVERGVRSEVMDEILLGTYTPDLWNRAANAGLYRDIEYAVIHIAHQASEDSAHSLWDKMSNLIQPCLERNKMVGISTTRKDRTILFVHAQDMSRDQAAACVHCLAEDISKALHQDSSLRQIMLGYSSRFAPLEKAKELHERACKALAAGRLMKGTCYDYEKLGIFKLLSKASPDEPMEELLPSGLHKLLKHDQEHNGSLVETLNAYFANSRNARAVARALFIHPKTALYRLNQISEIAELNLKDPGQMLEMEFGLELLAFCSQAGQLSKP